MDAQNLAAFTRKKMLGHQTIINPRLQQQKWNEI